MKIRLLLLSAISTTAIFGANHEVDFLYSKQISRDYTFESTPKIDFRPTNPNALTLRYGYNLSTIRQTILQLQIGYHTQSSASIADFTTHSYASTTYHFENLKNQSYSIGAQFQFQKTLQIGLGSEIRFERLNWDETSVDQTRPWINARIAYPFSSSFLKPTFGVEFALPLTNAGEPKPRYDNAGNYYPNTKDLMKRMSPKAEFSILAGIRF